MKHYFIVSLLQVTLIDATQMLAIEKALPESFANLALHVPKSFANLESELSWQIDFRPIFHLVRRKQKRQEAENVGAASFRGVPTRWPRSFENQGRLSNVENFDLRRKFKDID